VFARHAYRRDVEQSERSCELCGEPIDAAQAWMQAGDGAVAHSGCVYSDVTNVEQRDRWMPGESEPGA
jgi:hypothetical protein